MRAARFSLFVLFVLLSAPREARAAASPWAENEASRVRLVTAWTVAPRQGELRLGLHFRLEPGWHVYWKNSGDSGYPPSLKLVAAGGELSAPEILWPAPHRYQLPAGLVAFGYEDEVVYPVRAGLTAAGESLHLTGELDYVACHEECIPFSYVLELEQPLGEAGEADAETAPLLDAWWRRVPRLADEVPGVKTFGAVTRTGGRQELEVRVQGAGGSAAASDLFLESQELWNVDGKPQVKVSPAGLVFRVAVSPKRVDRELPPEAVLSWTVTGLELGGESLSLAATRKVEVHEGEAAPPAPAARREADLPRALLFAVQGGLLALASPSVLALTVALLAGLAADPAGRRAVREKAAAVATGALGGAWALVAAAHTAGLLSRLDERGRDPVALAVVAALSTALALGFWGYLEVPFGRRPAGTGWHLLAGLLLAPLAAGGWPLPRLAEAAHEASPSGSFAVAAVLAAGGVGLAAPFLVLAVVPSLVARASGGRLRKVPPGLAPALGFLAAGGVVWLLYRLSRAVVPSGLAWIELALLVVSLLAWARARFSGRPARAVLALALLAAIASVPWLAHQHRRVHSTFNEGGKP